MLLDCEVGVEVVVVVLLVVVAVFEFQAVWKDSTTMMFYLDPMRSL